MFTTYDCGHTCLIKFAHTCSCYSRAVTIPFTELQVQNVQMYDYYSRSATIWCVASIRIQWNLFIHCNRQVGAGTFLSVIRRCPLLGGFIIAWVWLITIFGDVIRPMTLQSEARGSTIRD